MTSLNLLLFPYEGSFNRHITINSRCLLLTSVSNRFTSDLRPVTILAGAVIDCCAFLLLHNKPNFEDLGDLLRWKNTYSFFSSLHIRAFSTVRTSQPQSILNRKQDTYSSLCSYRLERTKFCQESQQAIVLYWKVQRQCWPEQGRRLPAVAINNYLHATQPPCQRPQLSGGT